MDLKAAKLRIDERFVGDVVVLDMTGEMTIDEGDLVFRQKVHALLERGHAKLVLNLSDVAKLDSAGVGMLVAKLKTVRENGGDIKLLNLTEKSSRLLAVMKILTAFDSFSDEAKAVESFGQGA